jgi:hypothetical protein
MAAKTKKTKTKGKTIQRKIKLSKAKMHVKPADKVIAAIGKELRSNTRPAMFRDAGTDGSKSKLVRLDEEASEDALMTYYKNMVLRCIKCDGKFDHKASLAPVEYELKCPHCNEVHMLRLTPASGLFTVQSKTVEVEDKKK